MSRRILYRVRRAVLLIVAVLLSLAVAPRLAGADQQTATIVCKVRVFQEYKVQVSGLQNTFEYLIVPVEEDAPMPVDADGKTYDRFTLTRDQDMWLEFPVQVTVDPSATPYVYHYMLKPAHSELPDSLYYVDVLSTSLSAGVNEYPLEIHVQPSNVDAAVSIVTPTVHMEDWDDPKVADPGWRVAYKEPEDPDKPDPDKQDKPGTDSGKSDKTGKDTDKTGTDSGKDSGATNTPSGNAGTNAASSTPSTSVGNSSTNASASTSRTTTTETAATSSQTPLVTTGDVTSSPAVLVSVACIGTLLLACAAKLRKRAGEKDA